LGLVTWICTLSPQLIILGGGVMRQAGLIDCIRAKVLSLLNGYVAAPGIVMPALGGDAGVLGAIALAAEAR
jgi:fructokinase